MLRAAGAGVAARVVAVLASLISTIVLARVLGPENYGTYAYVIAVIALLSLPVQMGLPTLIVRETAAAAAREDWALMRGIWTWSTRVIVITSAILVAIVGGALIAFPGVVGAERYDALVWGVLLIPFLAFAAAREAAMRGLRAIVLSSLPDQILRPLLVAALVLSAGAILGTALSARLALQLTLCAAAVSFCLGAALLLRIRPREVASLNQSTMRHSDWLRTIGPFSLIAGLQLVRDSTDILMLGLWYGDADVGLYRIALSISNLAGFGLVALNIVAQPYIVSAFTARQTRALESLVRKIATLAASVALVVAGLIWWQGEAIISLLFGAAYVGAFSPLAILTAGSVAYAVFGLGATLLAMTGHEKKVLWSSVFSVGLNVLGNAILIPRYGLNGAAAATAGSLAFGEILRYFLARKHLRVEPSILIWLRRCD